VKERKYEQTDGCGRYVGPYGGSCPFFTAHSGMLQNNRTNYASRVCLNLSPRTAGISV